MNRAVRLFTPLFMVLSGTVGLAQAQPNGSPAPAGAPVATLAPAPAENGWTAAPAPAPAPAPSPAPAAAPGPAAPAPLAPTPLAPAAAPGTTPAAGSPSAAAVAAKPPAKDKPYDGPPLLLNSKKHKLGGYGGPTVAYSHMLHRDGVLFGAEGALLVDHRLSIGGAGYGFSRTPSGPRRADGVPREFATGYGGVVFRYAVFADFPVYASFGLLVGGGAIVLATDHEYQGDDGSDSDGDDWNGEAVGYFVAQPDISLHVNATRWLRFGVIGGYRFAGAVDKFNYDGGAVRGVVFGGNIQAGWL